MPSAQEGWPERGHPSWHVNNGTSNALHTSTVVWLTAATERLRELVDSPDAPDLPPLDHGPTRRHWTGTAYLLG